MSKMKDHAQSRPRGGKYQVVISTTTGFGAETVYDGNVLAEAKKFYNHYKKGESRTVVLYRMPECEVVEEFVPPQEQELLRGIK